MKPLLKTAQYFLTCFYIQVMHDVRATVGVTPYPPLPFPSYATTKTVHVWSIETM